MREIRRRNLLGPVVSVVILGLMVGCATTGQRTRFNDPFFLNQKTDAAVFVNPDSEITKVAIIPFKGPTELIGQSVSDLFVTYILRSRKYTIVERSQMASVLGETELALSGISDAEAVQAGQMLGADGVITGTVGQYEMEPVRGKSYATISVTVRLIDVRSGSVVWSCNHGGRADDYRMTMAKFGQEVVHEAVAALYKEWRRHDEARLRSAQK